MPETPSELRMPVVEETLSVGRQEVETDHVRVRTVVDVEETTVENQLRVGRLDVTRVAVEREVTEAPQPYRDGDTLVIPVVEERLVVEKRLFVIEELRVTGTTQDKSVQIPVSLRRMRAVVERDDSVQTETGEN